MAPTSQFAKTLKSSYNISATWSRLSMGSWRGATLSPNTSVASLKYHFLDMVSLFQKSSVEKITYLVSFLRSSSGIAHTVATSLESIWSTTSPVEQVSTTWELRTQVVSCKLPPPDHPVACPSLPGSSSVLSCSPSSLASRDTGYAQVSHGHLLLNTTDFVQSRDCLGCPEVWKGNLINDGASHQCHKVEDTSVVMASNDQNRIQEQDGHFILYTIIVKAVSLCMQCHSFHFDPTHMTLGTLYSWRWHHTL